MATVLLAAAGAAVGGAAGGSLLGLGTAVVGRAIGASLGRVIDQRLLGGGSQVVESGKLERFSLTGASEGTAIRNVYGRIRTGGQVIWSSRFRERVTTSESGGKGGGGQSVTTKTYTYSVSLAIALCEGEILRVGRIWADGLEIGREQLDMRVYTGSQTQLPDSKIEAVEGAGNAPAYRGTAYVVLEDLQLARFGNRVPQFSFEVMRAVDDASVPDGAESLSKIVKAVALVPGTGEYALATTPVHYSQGLGWNRSANVNSASGKSDFTTSMTALREELPNCGSASLVVSWFGDDLRCGTCSLRPKVEQTEIDGVRMPWSVSGLTREDAQSITQVDGRPIYGGTPTDQSVVEAVKALRDDGKSVMFYPFILMEQMAGNLLFDPWTAAPGQAHLPWRGRITTSVAPGLPDTPDQTPQAADEVRAFFGNAAPTDFWINGQTVQYYGPPEWSYRRFILHYAHLCAAAGGVDAFCIGSEMRSLTQIRSSRTEFPAVQELIQLAGEVRDILGPETKIGYAADWSEYFGYQPQDGSGDVLFHLDPLWARTEIDFVGIDNYMPLSDWRDGEDHADSDWESIYNPDYLAANVAGGEGYDWYYASEEDREAQVRSPIEDGAHGEPFVFRYKDLKGWWSSPHHDRIGGVRAAGPTDWVPQSKPIWFTELGCAAVDKGTNEPNKFVDPKSSESMLPHHSSGARDDVIQAQYLRATHAHWSDVANNPVSDLYGGPMLDMSRSHVWAWDVRPYPTFPANLDLWSDGNNYLLGHWLNGRTSSESLAAVVTEICNRSGLWEVDASALYGSVRGYRVEDIDGARAALQPLMLAHGFDGMERGGKLTFRMRTGTTTQTLTPGECAFTGRGDSAVTVQRSPEAESAGTVRLNHVQADGDFEASSAEAIFPDERPSTVSTSELPLSLTSGEAGAIVERWLAEARVARDTVEFGLPPSRRHIQAGDVIAFTGETTGRFRVDQVEFAEGQSLRATRIEPGVYRVRPTPEAPGSYKPVLAPVPVHDVFMDLPLLTGDEDAISPHLAVSATPWPGSVVVYMSMMDNDYRVRELVETKSVIGLTETPLHRAAPGVWDRGSRLRVRISGGTLSSVGRARLLSGANAMAISDGSGRGWEIFQFQNADLVGNDTYELSGLLRGQLGTDSVMPEAWGEGSTVVLLDGGPEQVKIRSAERNAELHVRIGPVSFPLDDPSFVHAVHSFEGVGLRPYAPVHLRAASLASGGAGITWIRRTRIDGDSWEGLDVALGEASESYLVQVVRNGVVLREATVPSPSWTYSASARAADTADGPVTVQVAQISDRFGPGLFRSIEIHG
ncbi:putative tail protein [Aliiruegeria haliotis]|uniref:Putative tail protein n=1 Tax=Aliiruegeria haliotis TaxID=1280846 RepID=A0A2T0RYW3_9RHOB|nr:glycoside hydrolase/phage tail family protein [Aliiruegeria haliotis]PRY26223.1 putative tail protein [Aliiruegeria haliotis]